MRKEVKALLADASLLLAKKPFTRGGDCSVDDPTDGRPERVGEMHRAVLPRLERRVVTQERFAKELDPQSHDVMFDRNIPTISVKLENGQYQDIKFLHTPVNLQERIREKQTLTMCGNPRQFTMRGADPTEKEKENFMMFREYWEDRNQDGATTEMVYHQLGYGDAGLLYYYNSRGEVKSRLISYEDGYVIISHRDQNGEHILECVYYADQDGVEHVDCYDDTYLYRVDNSVEGYAVRETVPHGFSEIPLVTKRGEVAWNKVQGLIDAFETLYNVFIVIQKRHGWGILYIKGRFDETVRKIAGSVVLQDRSVDGNGSAEFKTPPSPDGMLETMQSIYEYIQIGSGTTFILPKDVKTAGDISALAITLSQSLDIETATKNIIDWQNVIDKCARLFKEGLAKELVAKGINPNAVTEFKSMRVSSKFKIWRPFSETEYNNMLVSMRGAGIISLKTAIEKNTVSAPDEIARVQVEGEKMETDTQVTEE